MKLAISQLEIGENRFAFDSVKEPWLSELAKDLAKEGYSLEGPWTFNVQLTKLEPDYYLRGQMSFTSQQTCARCAEVFSLPLKHNFELALAHVASNTKEALKLSEESEELDMVFFEGNDLDLRPIAHEQFLLAQPYQSVCKADCKGICQHCGQNRNLQSCTCLEDKKLSVFDSLKTMKP